MCNDKNASLPLQIKMYFCKMEQEKKIKRYRIIVIAQSVLNVILILLLGFFTYTYFKTDFYKQSEMQHHFGSKGKRLRVKEKRVGIN